MAHAAEGGRKTHLELHHRLADHREKPRRQRDQLCGELVARHTGGDRRRRRPVPRKKDRHEQLEPLQPTHSLIRALACKPAAEGGKALDDGSRAFLADYYPVGTTVAVYPRVCFESAMRSR